MSILSLDLVTVCFVGLFSALNVFLVWVLRNKIRTWITTGIENDLITWFSREDNQKAVAENLQNLVVQPMVSSLKTAVFGMKGGMMKGINNQMDSLEKELISSEVETITGLPLGNLANDVIEKYPVIKSFLPLLLKGNNQSYTPSGVNKEIKIEWK